MRPEALIETTLLMGVLVAAGGAYGTLYSVGRLFQRPALIRGGVACWVVAALCAVAMAVFTPLAPGWKLLMLASAVVYAFVPPMTWRYLHQMHVAGGDEP